MKGVGMLVGNFEFKTPKGDLGVAQAFSTPKRDHVKNIDNIYIFLYFFTCNPKRDLHG